MVFPKSDNWDKPIGDLLAGVTKPVTKLDDQGDFHGFGMGLRKLGMSCLEENQGNYL